MGSHPQAPLAVIFDLGKVLLDFDYGRVARRMAGRCSVPQDKILTALDQSSLLHRFETGQMSKESFYQEVQRLTGCTAAFDEFAGAFGDIFTGIPEMIAWQARLKAAGVPTFIFSNTNEIAVAHIQRTFPFFTGFEGHVYSYQHGAMKPAESIYEVVEKITRTEPARIFYIDDRVENVGTAIRRGWQAVVHTSPETTLASAKAAGLPG